MVFGKDSEPCINKIKAFIEEKIRALFEWLGLDLESMRDRWREIWDNVKLITETVLERIRSFIEENIEAARAFIEEKVNLIKTFWETKWGEIQTTLEDILNTIIRIVSEKAQEIYDYWFGEEGFITKIVSKLGEAIETFKTKAKEILDGFISGITDKYQGVMDAVSGAISDAISTIGTFWQSLSDAGANLISGLALASVVH